MDITHSAAALRRPRAPRRGPNAWACALFALWIVLLAVPLAGLYLSDGNAPAGAPELAPKSWMPAYPPII